MKRFVVFAFVLAMLAAGAVASASATATDATTVLVSRMQNGEPPPDGAYDLSISDDGRYVVFTTDDLLTDDDTNGYRDVYMRDMSLGTTTLLSFTRKGEAGNSHSTGPALSGNGHYVAFVTNSTNFERDYNGNAEDVFVRNLLTGAVRRIDESTAGVQADGSSNGPVLDRSGRYVAFTSAAGNLVPGDTNDRGDVFLRDRKLGTTTRISLTDDGQQIPDGAGGPTMSASGRYVAFTTESSLAPADTNGTADVYVRDLVDGRTIPVSVADDGHFGNVQSYSYLSSRFAISADGRYVVFTSLADNLVPGDTNGETDVFVRDLVGQTTVRADVSTSGTEDIYGAELGSISANGRHVVFDTYGALVPHDTNGIGDIYERNLLQGTTRRLNIPDTGGQARGGNSLSPISSADGTCVAFQSTATNLDSSITEPGYQDVYMRELTGSCP